MQARERNIRLGIDARSGQHSEPSLACPDRNLGKERRLAYTRLTTEQDGCAAVAEVVKRAVQLLKLGLTPDEIRGRHLPESCARPAALQPVSVKAYRLPDTVR